MADLSNVRVDGKRLWDSLMEMAEISGRAEGRRQAPDADRSRPSVAASCSANGARPPAARSRSTRWATCSRAARARTIRSPPSWWAATSTLSRPAASSTARSGCSARSRVVRSLNDLNIRTRRPIEVANWTNEEGSRYAPAMISSGVFAGVYDKEFAYSRAGQRRQGAWETS